jgi:hypothetical protein
MHRSLRNYFLAGAVIASIIAVSPALAQSSGTENAPKKTFRESSKQKREKLEEQLRERQARIKAKQEADWRAAQATQRKRAACKKQAAAQNLHLLKRQRFMKKCMAES